MLDHVSYKHEKICNAKFYEHSLKIRLSSIISLLLLLPTNLLSNNKIFMSWQWEVY